MTAALFELPRPGAGKKTPIEQAAERTISELSAKGLLTADHTILCQLIMDLARAIGRAGEDGRSRPSGIAMAARELREAIGMLPIKEVDTASESDFDRIQQLLAAGQ